MLIFCVSDGHDISYWIILQTVSTFLYDKCFEFHSLFRRYVWQSTSYTLIWLLARQQNMMSHEKQCMLITVFIQTKLKSIFLCCILFVPDVVNSFIVLFYLPWFIQMNVVRCTKSIYRFLENVEYFLWVYWTDTYRFTERPENTCFKLHESI